MPPLVNSNQRATAVIGVYDIDLDKYISTSALWMRIYECVIDYLICNLPIAYALGNYILDDRMVMPYIAP